MKISQKLQIGFLAIVVPVTFINAINSFSIHKNLIELGDFHQTALYSIQNIAISTTNAVEHSFIYILSGRSNEKELFLAQVEEIKLANERFSQIAKFDRSEEEGERHLFQEIERNQARLFQQAVVIFDEYEANGKVGQESLSNYEAIIHQINNNYKELIESEKLEVNTAHNQAIAVITHAINSFIFTGILALGLSVVSSHFLTKAISQPINRLKRAAISIGQGNLNTRVDIDSNDEITILADTINQMVEGLKTTTVSKSYLDNIIASMIDPLVVINLNLVIVKVNQVTINLLGYTENELLGRSIKFLLTEDTRFIVDRLLRDELIENLELSYLTKTGEQIPVSFSASLMQDSTGKNQGIVCVARDITEQKRIEAQLRHDALHDGLTGLPNRTLFINRLEQAIAMTTRCQERLFAILFLDLDHFKLVNDSLGHLAGDQLLVTIAHRLRKHLRAGDTLARLGGDEFVFLLEDLKTRDEAIKVVEQIQQELKLPLVLNEQKVFANASIGLLLETSGYHQPEELLRDADTAMYRAKAAGRGCYKAFTQIMHDQALKSLKLETDLRQALKNHELLLYYQPIVSLPTSRITGFEALLRWQHPQRGLVSPQEFIPIAEETGLITSIGQWVLQTACRQLREWHLKFPQRQQLTMSINISGKQFSQPDLVQQVAQTLQTTELAAHSLMLEITESVIMESTDPAAMLRQLKSLGVGLSMDDFGTGYSSLSYLHSFPINRLKIDRSFISNIDVDSEKIQIVRTIVALAWNLGMDVVDEGVETKKQMYQLQALKCDFGQGYFFAKPLNQEQAEMLIAQESPMILSK